MAGVFRKKLIDKIGKALFEAPFIYDRIILTTTTTGTIVGGIIGAQEPGNKTLCDSVTNSLIFSSCGGILGFAVGVLSPVIIPISVVGGIIGGASYGFSVIKDKINE